MATESYPVHEDVTVHDGETIYRTDDWWKAAVTHSYADSDPEIAIYLWHRDDDWMRKNKYHVKTAEAWESDKIRIEKYLSESGNRVSDQDAFPVSDYYHVAQGESVFEADEWWKAVVAIDQKGSYETHEVIIYLWQRVEGDWRRRQKYAVKNIDDWNDDRTAVDTLLGVKSDSMANTSTAEPDESASYTDQKSETAVLEEIESEIMDVHLGSGVAERD